ncbi:MAG TPA: hypothetical protein VE988_03615 [Gemmataceae bacterium]|nr:hypothetical protein [Gemmataceae bacterium]
MKHFKPLLFATFTLLLAAMAARADVQITVEHNSNADATADFKFKKIPSPTMETAARKATVSIVSGKKDGNGGPVTLLTDGKLPTDEDEPAANFFFNQGSKGGRVLMDLGKVIEIKQVNTYSWHPNTRGPQVYKLYVSDGTAKDFSAQPKAGTDPATVGWKLLATVDTRPKAGEEEGGQYGVSIADSKAASLGKYRYLLFDMSRTEDVDPFGNTFYSEITVVEKK